MHAAPAVQLRAAHARLTLRQDGGVELTEDQPGALALALAAAATGPAARDAAPRGWSASTGHVLVDRYAALSPADPRVRAVDVDQTHHSWVVDDRLQVKVAATSGTLDHGARQARRAPGVVPALFATLRWRGPAGDVVLATVSAHVADAADGWTWAVDDVLDALARPEADDPSWPAELGALTARLHVALATGPPPTGVPGPDADARERAMAAVTGALAVTTGATHRRLAARVPALATAVASLPLEPTSRPFAVHGDLHVGQVLRSAAGYHVVDLDGDPQLGPRLDHAARDLAHLLVSVDTVARVVQRRLGTADLRALAWARRARASLRAAYRAGLAAADADDLLDERLLAGFEAEQVVRELLHAAQHLPRWTYAGEGALVARYPATRTAGCGRCTDPACGSDEEDPWTPPPSAPTST